MEKNYSLRINSLKEQIFEIEKAIKKEKHNDNEQLINELLFKKHRLEKLIKIVEEDFKRHLETETLENNSENNLEKIGHFDLFQIIPKLINEGGDNNYLVFNIDTKKNYFMDITAVKGEKLLYCNAVSNYHLEKQNILSSDRIKLFLDRGWGIQKDDMESNFFHKMFSFNNKNDLIRIIDSFRFLIENVYDTKFSENLKMRLYLG